MRAFIVALFAAVLLAYGAAVVLNSYVPDSSSSAFSTTGVRI